MRQLLVRVQPSLRQALGDRVVRVQDRTLESHVPGHDRDHGHGPWESRSPLRSGRRSGWGRSRCFASPARSSRCRRPSWERSYWPSGRSRDRHPAKIILQGLFQLSRPVTPLAVWPPLKLLSTTAYLANWGRHWSHASTDASAAGLVETSTVNRPLLSRMPLEQPGRPWPVVVVHAIHDQARRASAVVRQAGLTQRSTRGHRVVTF